MALIYTTVPGAQNPRFGISHYNIADKLTRANYSNKAVVRDGEYIWVCKAKKHQGKDKKDKTVYLFKINVRNVKDKEFTELQDAIDYANDWADYEGDYPLEYEAPWVIRTFPFRRRK
jgi:hypothetical protein